MFLLIRLIPFTMFTLILSCTAAGTPGKAEESKTAVEKLNTQLNQSSIARLEIADEPFSTFPLIKEDSKTATALLWQAYQDFIRETYMDEWQDKQFNHGEFVMKFDYKTFGSKPKGGRNLFISMHGGGGAPARVNDQQWKNQIGLYKPDEGIYLAPRAPTNEWNLWHLPHIDALFDQIIQAALVFEDVNPNRVYLMGYSAGGDGVFQLAPRMADRFAAAAMMAGHPNETVPLGLRNLPFTLHMGAEDAAYDRNKVARKWKEELAALRQNDPEGYFHDVQIHEGKGHWMDKEDAVALEWMTQFTRNPLPKKVVWKQDDVTHPRFYWLAVDEENENERSEIVVERDGQEFEIQKAEGINALTILLNDEMVDMDEAVRVRFKGKTLFEGTVSRTIKTLHETLMERGDLDLVFSGRIDVELD